MSRTPPGVVAPYKLRPSPPEVGLLREDGRVLGERGDGLRVRDLAKGVQVWAPEDRVLRLLRTGRGRALCWRGRPIRYAPAGLENYRVRVLALPFPDDERALAGLVAWRDWLAEYGAAPGGSLGSSSMSLLRATLERELWTSVPFDAAPPFRFTVGGRQQLGPRGAPAEFSGRLAHFDMRAAYASRLAGLEYGGHWFRLHPAGLLVQAPLLAQRPGRLVFCRARVHLGGAFPGPLVRRPRSEPETVLGSFADYPLRGIVQGVWTWAELRAAAEYGARVRLLDGWAHVADTYPFRPWWAAVEQGRRLLEFAGLLAKATGNALWGQFAISPHGRRQVLYYTAGGRRVVRELPTTGSRRPAHDLAEFLTGSVRADLFRFCAAAGPRLACAHTDGGWVDAAGGWRFEGWRIKDRAAHLRVLDPQLLAYRRPGEETERYVVSGWPADGAAELFEQAWSERRVAA